jgi:hypothetical protein
MADNPQVNTNTTAVGATNVTVAGDDIGGVVHQLVKVEFGAADSATQVSAANPLPVVQTGTPALPTGAATEATLSTLNGKMPAQGQAAMAASQPVVIANNQSAVPVSASALPLPSGAATEATLSTLNGKIPAAVGGSQPCTLRNAAGTAIGSLALATALEGILTSAGATDFFFSTANATTAQLAAAATFTGAVESIVSAQAWSIILTTDQPGTLTIREYIDAGGTRITSTKTISVAANVPLSRCYTANGNYFNLTFQNTGGSTTTTLNINTAFGVLPAVTSLGHGPVALNEVSGTAFSLGQQAGSVALPVNLSNDLVVGAAASIAALNIDLLTGNASGWYDAANFHSVAIQIIGSAGITAGAIFFEQTNDTTVASAGNIWPVEEMTGLTPTPNIAAITIAASTTRMFCGPVVSRYVRVRVSTAFATANVQAVGVFSQLPYVRPVQTVHQATAGNLNATATIASGTVTTVTTLTTLANGQTAHSAASTGSPVRIAGRVVTTPDVTLATGDAADLLVTTGQQLVTKDFATSEADWQSAAGASGIVNSTTAVTLKAAGAASTRNFLTALQISHDLLGAVTELVIRDGAAGTVIYRTKLQTPATDGFTVVFPTPLRGTAATLMEVALLTAVTGGVYVNAQGYQSF